MKKILLVWARVLFITNPVGAYYCKDAVNKSCNPYTGTEGCRDWKYDTNQCRTRCECTRTISGYYLANDHSPTICPKGYYCPGDNNKWNCGTGTYNDTTKAGGQNACKKCSTLKIDNGTCSECTTVGKCTKGNCNSGYSWDATLVKCVAKLNCSKYNPAHGTCSTCHNGGCDELNCDKGYEANYGTMTCEIAVTATCRAPFIRSDDGKCCLVPSN